MITKSPVPSAEFHEKNQAARERLIRDCLINMRTNNVSVKRITGLSKMVAEFISTAEGQPCASTTLTRKMRYKVLLSQFMGGKEIGLTVSAETEALSHGFLATYEAAIGNLQLGNLRAENARLLVYLTDLENELDSLKNPGTALKAKTNTNTDDAEATYDKFVNSNRIINALIQRFPKVLGVDKKTGTIMDFSNYSNPVIVSADLAKDYFIWLEAFGMIGDARLYARKD